MKSKKSEDSKIALEFQKSRGFTDGMLKKPLSIWSTSIVTNELKKTYEEAYKDGINASKSGGDYKTAVISKKKLIR